MFEQALVRAIKQRDLTDGDGETLRKVSEALLNKAIDGDITAAKEIRDTLDGKPAQAITGADGGPLEIAKVIVEIVDPQGSGSAQA